MVSRRISRLQSVPDGLAFDGNRHAIVSRLGFALARRETSTLPGAVLLVTTRAQTRVVRQKGQKLGAGEVVHGGRSRGSPGRSLGENPADAEFLAEELVLVEVADLRSRTPRALGRFGGRRGYPGAGTGRGRGAE